MRAVDLIDSLLEGVWKKGYQRSKGFGKSAPSDIVKGDYLSASELLDLKFGTPIYYKRRRATVISAETVGSNVEMVYVMGRRPKGSEKWYIVPKGASKTEVQEYTRINPADFTGYRESVESLIEKLTKGMRKAYERSPHKMKCAECGTTIPSYPGRYPAKCPDCGERLEDLQNAPRYSEKKDKDRDKRRAYGQQSRVVTKANRIGGEAVEAYHAGLPARSIVEAITGGDINIRSFYDSGVLCFATPDDVIINPGIDQRIDTIHVLANEFEWPDAHPIHALLETYEGSLQGLYASVLRLANLG